MDPVTLIVTALAAGASAGARDTATQLVKDAYAGLKALVTRRVADQPGGAVVVREHAADPDTWQAPLIKAVTGSGAHTDPEAVALAQRLMSGLDPTGTAAGRYQVTVTTGANAVVGKGAAAHQTFGDVTVTASGERSVAANTIIDGVRTGDQQPRRD